MSAGVTDYGLEAMRDNWLSNPVFTGRDDIVGLCCFYWNRLIEMPWRIMSIGMRDWARRF